MERLSYKTLGETGRDDYFLERAPERVLQFGEGNFLRAFVDDFFDIANEKAGFNGKVVVVSPIEGPLLPKFREQDCLYTLYLRGMEEGKKVEERRLISVISRVLDATKEFGEVLSCALNPELKFIVSNTTEAGIVFRDTDRFDDPEHGSYPAKLTRFLYERFEKCGGEYAEGFVLLPCELIEENGKNLRRCVLQYAELWDLGGKFEKWLGERNTFCSTLVDRIVPGYPKDDALRYTDENGYEDALLDAAEPFGFWAIEGDGDLNDVLPFKKAGLPILVTPDISFYKKRKVWVLNGGHTTMCTTALLAGLETVGECMEDRDILGMLEKSEYGEIIPAAPLPEKELMDFAGKVMDRFRNPFIRHMLMSISLNTTSKWRARVLPSVKNYLAKYGRLPEALLFGFASNLMFGISGRFEVKDDPEVLEFFEKHRDDAPDELAKAYCGEESFWGEDLGLIPGFAEKVTDNIRNMRTLGVREALRKVLQK
ncbi:MAG: tagaturonate reductase [Eubacteriales bacterium]|nr:tagaturonate reductase [Eubacteriales bacterium]